jgi:endo-1,4-beta-mannosidase
MLHGQPFTVRGVNYYPRHAPWQRFLPEGDLTEMAAELDLITAAGFNTLRIFLWYDALFTCAPEQAQPNPAAFAKLDAFFSLARARQLRLIVTLHDLPDLYFRPLYTDWPRYDAQTTFIVTRYRAEPAILAWDLRNEGDLDYSSAEAPRFERRVVLTWLAHAAEVVRAGDNQHLLTAGWWGSGTEIAPWVDIISFHHWTTAGRLDERLAEMTQLTRQPLLLEEVGYAAQTPTQQEVQAARLKDVLQLAETRSLAGWLIWTAFDFEPQPGEPFNHEHFFGLWQTDLKPKPALGVLPMSTPAAPLP